MNQYAPPDAAPTARLLGDLAEFLEARGHTVEFLSDRRDYRRRPEKQRLARRVGREVRAILNLLRAGLRRRRQSEPQPAIVLALSSPPLLLLLAAIVAWRQRAQLVHWAMDLYPELAVALMHQVKRGLGYRLLQTAMGVAYRRATLVVALDDDMRRHLREIYRLRAVEVMPPWCPNLPESLPLEIQVEQSKRAARTLPLAYSEPRALESETGEKRAWRWLYSGNLGRAHEWETLLNAQRLLEARGLPVELIFQGGGNARGAARECAATLQLRQCHWLDYVAEADLVASLLAAQVLVVTQRLETRGLLWPSKLAALLCLSRPILFIGPTEGAIAAELRERGRGPVGIFAPGCDAAVADWIASFYREEKSSLREEICLGAHAAILATLAQEQREQGCQRWEQWLRNIVAGESAVGTHSV